ncbi:MAG: HRDC domain-containing protein [Thermodesulfobacteriota bacterium]|nr:HRDC domain-containing protein [Thermodesulfobacteriota bacterium]
MITTAEDLKALMERAHKTDAVALDTEFIWERTFYPKLGLIQLALSNEECFLIDPCALEDLSPLGKLLADPAVVKIFHDAPQDLAILRNATGKDPQNIFDTRLAAGFGGLSSTLSLSALIELLLDIKLNKSETRTNWLKRPLDSKQTDYALDDVRYLRAARILLLARVLPTTRKWMEEELRRLNKPENYIGISDDKRYTKIKGAGSLSQFPLAILQELAIWREKEAKRRNRPRGHIIRDSVLLAIAKGRLRDNDAIQSCGEISAKTVAAYGDKLSQLVGIGLKRSETDCPQLLRETKLNKTEQTALSRLQDYITLKSDVNGVDPALIGNKGELKRCIKNTSPSTSRQKKGWRKEFLAEMKE